MGVCKQILKTWGKIFGGLLLGCSLLTTPAVALTLDEGAYLILNEENRSFRFLNREEKFSLPDGREVQLRIDGTYDFSETGQQNIRLQDGRILMLQSDQSYGYFEGEMIQMPNGLTLRLNSDSTYQLMSSFEQLFPLRNGKLILLKQDNHYEYITADSDFTRFWKPRMLELQSQLCRNTLREEEDLQKLVSTQIELDRLVEYMQMVGAEKQIQDMTGQRMQVVYSPDCRTAG